MKKFSLALALCSSVFVAITFIGYRQLNHDQAIHLGQRREGVLRQSDPIRNELPRGPESRWRFEGRAGQTITISVESYEFDVYLVLLDPLNHPIDASDNNGGFFNAKIRGALQATGRYTVIVCGANADQFGTYWLSLDAGDRDVDWSQAAVESYYGRGTQWAERSMNRRALSWMSLGMAQYLRQRGQWDKADKYSAESLARAEEDDFTYDQWAVALERGRLFARRRWYDKAVSEFERALQLCKRLRAAEEAETLVLIEIGNLYFATARADMAKVYFDTATKQAQQYALPSSRISMC